MAVLSREIEYLADGRRAVGELSVEEYQEGQSAGVLVCHEGTGLSSHTKNVARRLAGRGYVAFALDYFGDGLEPPAQEAKRWLDELAADPMRTREAGSAGLEVLVSEPRCDSSRVAVIGYCFGGSMALEMARAGTPLCCVVGFHSRLATSRPEDAQRITAKVLVNIGADDPWIRAEERAAFEREMREGGVDWQMNVYGGVRHSFTNPAADGTIHPGLVYDEQADTRSWNAMLSLFDETLAARTGAGSR